MVLVLVQHWKYSKPIWSPLDKIEIIYLWFVTLNTAKHTQVKDKKAEEGTGLKPVRSRWQGRPNGQQVTIEHQLAD